MYLFLRFVFSGQVTDFPLTVIIKICCCLVTKWSKIEVAQSPPTLCNTTDYTVHEFFRPETGVGSLSLLRGIFPTQEWNQGFLHCRRILYQLSYHRSPIAKSCPTLVTPWTVVCQAPLSTGLPRQEYWSGLPFPSPGDLPDPGIKPVSPELAGGCFTTEPPGKPNNIDYF